MEKEIISDIMKLGCKNRVNAVITYQVYIELIEVQHLYDVSYFYNENLERMYLLAKNPKGREEAIYVPITPAESICFKKMEEILELCKTKPKKIFLALVSSDSTCVYYQLLEGLIPVQDLNHENSRFSKKQKLDKELNKRQKEIRQAAFLNLPLSSIESNVNV